MSACIAAYVHGAEARSWVCAVQQGQKGHEALPGNLKPPPQMGFGLASFMDSHQASSATPRPSAACTALPALPTS